MNDKLQQKTHDGLRPAALQIQGLLAEAISKNLSIKELAGKIWLGAVQNNFGKSSRG